jgi:hypothetical protein
VDYQIFNDFFVTVKFSTIFDAFFPFPTIGNKKMHFLDQYVVMIITCELYNFCIFILQHVSHATFPFPSIGNKKMHFTATIHFLQNMSEQSIHVEKHTKEYLVN